MVAVVTLGSRGTTGLKDEILSCETDNWCTDKFWGVESKYVNFSTEFSNSDIVGFKTTLLQIVEFEPL